MARPPPASAGPVLAIDTARSSVFDGWITVPTSGICRVAQYQSLRNVSWICWTACWLPPRRPSNGAGSGRGFCEGVQDHFLPERKSFTTVSTTARDRLGYLE